MLVMAPIPTCMNLNSWHFSTVMVVYGAMCVVCCDAVGYAQGIHLLRLALECNMPQERLVVYTLVFLTYYIREVSCYHK
jgi:hypothetical protein